MDDNDDWTKPVQQPKPNPRGNRGRPAEPPAPKEQQHSDDIKDPLNQSDWLDPKPEESSQKQSSGRLRGKAAQQTDSPFNSSTKSKPSERETIRTELKPDDQEDSWALENNKTQAPKQRGNRGVGERGFDGEEVPKRGNRGNRQGQDIEGGFKKKSHFEQGQQICSEGSNSGRSDNWGNRDGYRGRGRGRGGYNAYRGGNRNFNDRQAPQQPPSRGNRQFIQKDNQPDNRSQYNPRNNDYRPNQPRNNQYENRGPNQDTRNNDNRYQRPYQSSYSNQQYQDRPTYASQLTPAPAPSYNPPKQQVIAFQPPGAGWESSNVCDTSFQVLGPEQQPAREVVILREKDVKPMPRGRKTWPEASMHIQKCKMTITYRQINEFACKLLVLPYITTKMEYYPRNIINSSSFDYRKKIMEKTAKAEEITRPGAVYLQKAVEVGSFVALAFLKIDVGRLEESLKTGVKEVLRLAESLERQQLDSIVFPICPQLGNAGWVVRPLLDNLENCRKLRQFYVTTNQPACFISAVKEFTAKVEQLLNENEIYIN